MHYTAPSAVWHHQSCFTQLVHHLPNPPSGNIQPPLAIPVVIPQVKAVLEDSPWPSEEDEPVIVPQPMSKEHPKVVGRQTDRQTDRQTVIYKYMHDKQEGRRGNACGTLVAHFSPYSGTQIFVGRIDLLTKATS